MTFKLRKVSYFFFECNIASTDVVHVYSTQEILIFVTLTVYMVVDILKNAEND